MRRVATLAILAVAAVGLASCQTLTAVQLTCLPLKTYTPAEQKALADAMAALDPTSPLIGLAGDYSAMRDADRACVAAKS